MELSTKNFGKINIDVDDGDGETEINYDNQDINIFLEEFSSYGDKVDVCLEMIDNYVEMDEIIKKAIMENFFEHEIVKYYFESHFDILEKENLMEIFGTDIFEEVNSKKVAENLNFPDSLYFSIENNEIKVSIDYMVSKEYSDEILCVEMDEKLNVTNFSHES